MNSTHPLAFPMVMVFRGSLASLSRTCLCGAVSVAEDVVFLGDMGVHSLGDGSRICMSLTADDEIVSWQGRLVHARALFSCSERDSEARGHQSVFVEDSLRFLAEFLELTKDQCDGDGQ